MKQIDAGRSAFDATMFKVSSRCPAYNMNTDRDTSIPAGTSLEPVDQSDKGMVFKDGNGVKYHVDFYDLKNIPEKSAK